MENGEVNTTLADGDRERAYSCIMRDILQGGGRRYLLQHSPCFRRVFCRLWCSDAERTHPSYNGMGVTLSKCSGCGAIRVYIHTQVPPKRNPSRITTA